MWQSLLCRVLFVFVLFLWAGSSDAAYFLLEEGVERCFSEEVLSHQVLRLEYSVKNHAEPHDGGSGSGSGSEEERQCSILVKDADGKAIKEHAVLKDSREGALALVTQGEGRHQVCLSCPSLEWFGKRRQYRWSLKFDVVGSSIMGDLDPKKLAPFTRMRASQDSINDVFARLLAIRSENENEKVDEDRFARTSDAVNVDVAAFKGGQILLVAIAAALELQHLLQFLRKNHLNCVSCLPMRNRPVL
mmetsp:Transcript_7093/g.10422  ORF Transcript_7093/g.10422 Transcript_7093/m.10422 type:complete len:246 (+) Transcript_7093:3-740(+)